MISSIEDIFGQVPAIDLSKAVCHSGGAEGSDTIWEIESAKYGTKTKAYSYKTAYHGSSNKVEISEEEFEEGVEMINKANTTLKRYGINKYINLLARNWSQVKHSEQLFAIGKIVPAGKKGSKYYNRSNYDIVEGGTGYAVQMSIDCGKPTFVFDINKDEWYTWSSASKCFIKCKEYPVITKLNFAGIGTRNITENGIKAIKELLKLTHYKFNKG